MMDRGGSVAYMFADDWGDENDTAQNLGSDNFLGTNIPTNLPLTYPQKHITSSDFAALANINISRAQAIFKNGKYKGSLLDLEAVQSNAGRGGKAYRLHVDSLPSELRAKYYLQFGIDIHAKKVAGHETSTAKINEAMRFDPAYEAARKLAAWRLNIIRPILDHPYRSKGRMNVINAILADGVIDQNGHNKKIGKVTLYLWIKQYEENGLNGLMRKKRGDTEKKRVIVTRKWDYFFKGYVSESIQHDIGDEIRGYIRSLWAAGASGWTAVSEQAATKLIELSDALAVPEFRVLDQGNPRDKSSARTRFGVCNISRRFAEDERRYRLLAIKDKDNALYQDKYSASISRDYSAIKPREMIVGDVHPVDVMMRRADGSMVYPKAISWMDPATNEIHMTFVLCEKGEGIRREHVAQSFEAMTHDWGLPKLLYLDNGSEYKWTEMIDGFTMLSKLAGSMAVYDLDTDKHVNERVANARESVIRSLAYNAKGKPKIEGAFGNIEKVFFSTIKGWTAGDRMNKKTHLKGRDPIAFDGDGIAFLETASQALQWYHKRPQHGRLNGKSPNEALAEYIDNGWGKTILKRPEVMALAFATTEERRVDRGTVQYTPRPIKGQRGKTIRFYHDDLLMLTGQTITIKIPAYNPEYVFCYDRNKLVCIATPERSYHPLDIEGAKEGSRRNKYLRRQIAEKRSHCALLSLTDEVERHIAHLPDAPDVPVAASVSVEILEQMAALQDKERAEIEAANEKLPIKEISQWGVTNENNPLLQNVTFLEDDEE